MLYHLLAFPPPWERLDCLVLKAISPQGRQQRQQAVEASHFYLLPFFALDLLSTKIPSLLPCRLSSSPGNEQDFAHSQNPPSSIRPRLATRSDSPKFQNESCCCCYCCSWFSRPSSIAYLVLLSSGTSRHSSRFVHPKSIQRAQASSSIQSRNDDDDATPQRSTNYILVCKKKQLVLFIHCIRSFLSPPLCFGRCQAVAPSRAVVCKPAYLGQAHLAELPPGQPISQRRIPLFPLSNLVCSLQQTFLGPSPAVGSFGWICLLFPTPLFQGLSLPISTYPRLLWFGFPPAC